MSLLSDNTENTVRAKAVKYVDITSLDDGHGDELVPNPLLDLVFPALGCAGRSLILYFHTKILKITVNTLETVTGVR